MSHDLIGCPRAQQIWTKLANWIWNITGQTIRTTITSIVFLEDTIQDKTERQLVRYLTMAAVDMLLENSQQESV